MGALAWIAGIPLALMMAMTGGMKLIGHDMVKQNMARLGVNDTLTRLIGVDEVLASAGLVIGLLAGNGDYEWIGFLTGIAVIALLIGALTYHRRVGDPPKEMAPALMGIVLAVLYLVGIMGR